MKSKRAYLRNQLLHSLNRDNHDQQNSDMEFVKKKLHHQIFGSKILHTKNTQIAAIFANNKATYISKTLPKALRTQALTALTSNFGLVGLVQYAWNAKFDLVW